MEDEVNDGAVMAAIEMAAWRRQHQPAEVAEEQDEVNEGAVMAAIEGAAWRQQHPPAWWHRHWHRPTIRHQPNSSSS